MLEGGGYEAALAAEGSSLNEDERAAFALQFALAEDVAAKRALAHSRFVPSSVEFEFHDAMCTLLEVQELVNTGSSASDTAAWELLATEKQRLEAVEQVLRSASASRKLKRVQQRRLLLELELKHRLGKPASDVALTANEFAMAASVYFQDPEPSNVQSITKKESYPSELDELHVSTDGRIEVEWSNIQLLSSSQTTKRALQRMETLPLEVIFGKIVQSLSDSTSEVPSSLLKLFLDDFSFEYTNLPGFVDVVVEDMRRERGRVFNQGFCFRRAHEHMPISQLQECFDRDPAFFRDNVQFACRGVELLQSAATHESEAHPALEEEVKLREQIDTFDRCLQFLDQFSSVVTSARLVLRREQLRVYLALYWRSPDTAAQILSALAQYLEISGGRGLQLPEAAFGSIGSISYPGMSQFPHEELVKTTLERLWGSSIDPSDVFGALERYVGKELLETEQARAMVKQGRGELSKWIDKLPEKGRELQAMTHLTDISFCESNPSYYGPSDPLVVYTRVRNVKSLTAHLYTIKTEEYYSRLRHEIRGNICLDGLLPNEEVVVDLSHLSAWQEARVPIEFSGAHRGNPERGVYVVEILEKGQTCRAILRRGFLRHVQRITSRGHELVVLDEQGDLLRETRAVVLNLKAGGSRAQQGREYVSDENGLIVIPFRQGAGSISSDKFALMLCHGPFGFFRQSFHYVSESFELAAEMHVDAEQLLPGARAQLLARPHLWIENIDISLDRLVDVQLTVEFKLVNDGSADTNTHTEVQRFVSMSHFQQTPASFDIPVDAESFSVQLSARVGKVGQDRVLLSGSENRELPFVRCSERFNVQRVSQHDMTYSPHFIRRAVRNSSGSDEHHDEFSVMVLGHNGEPVPAVVVDVTVRNIHFSTPVEVKMQTNSDGEVKLGELSDISNVSVSLQKPSGQKFECAWDLPNRVAYRPGTIHCVVGDTVELPIPHAYARQAASWMANSMISMYSVIDIRQSHTVFEAATHDSVLTVVENDAREAVCISAKPNRAGTFLVCIRPLSLKFEIVACAATMCKSIAPLSVKALLRSQELLLATMVKPLMIFSQSVGYDTDTGLPYLDVGIRNGSADSTRVFVLVKHLQDARQMSLDRFVEDSDKEPVSHSRLTLSQVSFKPQLFNNEFLKKRKISDEYSYILQRRALAGSTESLSHSGAPFTISKPSLIQSPHVASSSDMEVVTVSDGDKVTGFSANQSLDVESRKSRAKKSKNRLNVIDLVTGHSVGGYSAPVSIPSLPSFEFLGEFSFCISAIAVDSDGRARVNLLETMDKLPLSGQCEFNVVTIVQDTETNQICAQESVVPLRQPTSLKRLPMKDITLSSDEALAPQLHFHQKDQHECVRKGEERSLNRAFGSKYAIYQSFESAVDLWKVMVATSHVKDLAEQLKSWFQQGVQSKLQYYYANACDELHFFLYKKDREFFASYVRPLVATKLSKSFIDYYVLHDEVNMSARYLRPRVFDGLSVVEKLLIAETVSDVETVARICDSVIMHIDRVFRNGGRFALRNIYNTVLSQGQVKPDDNVDFDEDNLEFCQVVETTEVEAITEIIETTETIETTEEAIEACMTPLPPHGGGFWFGGSAIGASSSFGYAAAPTTQAPQSIQERRQSSAPGSSVVSDMEILEYEEESDLGVESLDSVSDSGEEESERDGDSKSKRKAKQDTPYIPPGTVRKVIEKRFFSEQRPHLVGANNFWKEYAEYLKTSTSSGQGSSRPFLSSYFPEALSSLTEGLFAIAVLDLGMIPARTTIKVVPGSSNQLSLVAASDLIFYHRSVAPAEASPSANTELIVKQKIVSADDVGSASENIRLGEIVIHKIYTAVVTVSNVGGSAARGVNLLLQVPQGSIPLTKLGFYTKNELVDIPPNNTREFTYSFYFPEPGEFDHYPAHASLNGFVVAWAGSNANATRDKLHVVSKATQVNLTSWSDVSGRGSLDDVLTFLTSADSSVHIDYSKLYWRCRDTDFYQGLVKYLREKMMFDNSIWKHSLQHGDIVGIQEYLTGSTDVIQSIGNGLATSFVNVERMYHSERFGHELASFDHVEFGPFLSRRAHPVTGTVAVESGFGHGTRVGGARDRILNASARQYFLELCLRLGMYVRLSPEHLVVLVYYMLLLNRTDDALQLFRRFEALSESSKASAVGTVQFDYLRAFVDFLHHDGDQGNHRFEVARELVAKYVDHPNHRWSDRFKTMADFLEEYDEFELQKLNRLDRATVSDSTANSDRTDNPPATAPPRVSQPQVKLHAVITGNSIDISAQNLRSCEVLFYPIDVELMFSTDPFNTFAESGSSSSSKMLLIEPRLQLVVDLTSQQRPDDSGWVQQRLAVPTDLASSQMMVRVREAPEAREISSVAPLADVTRPYFNSSLEVVTMPQLGLLQVLHDGAPVRSCYVKAYVKVSLTSRGAKRTQFYKDGYTDLLGKFDYAAINGDLLSSVETFSLLVSHPTFGATVTQVSPPVLASTTGDFAHKEAFERLLY